MEFHITALVASVFDDFLTLRVSLSLFSILLAAPPRLKDLGLKLMRSCCNDVWAHCNAVAGLLKALKLRSRKAWRAPLRMLHLEHKIRITSPRVLGRQVAHVMLATMSRIVCTAGQSGEVLPQSRIAFRKAWEVIGVAVGVEWRDQ